MKLGIGTAALGRPQYINVRLKKTDHSNLAAFKAHSFLVLEDAYKLGIRYFDTAPGYGLAETLLLEWLQNKNDNTIEIATKWGYTYTANFDPNAKVHEVKEHSLKKLKAQWAFSKQFLPYLKVYQIHSATLDTGVLNNELVLNYLSSLKKAHNLKIGITTTGANQVEVIKKALDIEVNGIGLFDVFQVTYNMLDQSLKTILDVLITQKKSVVIKEALANGRIFRNENYAHYAKLYNLLERLSNKYKVGIDAISLQFCAQTIPSSIVLSGASDTIQLHENLKAKNVELLQEELDEIAAFKSDTQDYWNERKQLRWN